jgi:hypothetical protein
MIDNRAQLLENSVVIFLSINRARAFCPAARPAHLFLRSLARSQIVKDPEYGRAAAAHQRVLRAKAQKPSLEFRNFRISG